MTSYKPALVVVDVQEDFCPPSGSLAVAGGRDIAPIINKLLELPFALKVATQDWHPRDHISFAANHPAPNNKPFESMVTVTNPLNNEESETIRLWPVHCVQDTKGAEILPELNTSALNHIVKKGQDSRIEMYSAFRDTYKKPCVYESDLPKVLKDASVTHVFVVGIAQEVCVKHTALHAAEDGFETYVIREATAAIDNSDQAFESLHKELQQVGARFCTLSGPELAQVGKA